MEDSGVTVGTKGGEDMVRCVVGGEDMVRCVVRCDGSDRLRVGELQCDDGARPGTTVRGESEEAN